MGILEIVDYIVSSVISDKIKVWLDSIPIRKILHCKSAKFATKNKLSEMRLSFNTKWKNKKWGMIERRNQDDTLLHFVETTHPHSTNPYQYMSPPSEKYPVLAEGIIAFYLCNQGRNIIDIYNDYYRNLREIYVKSESKKIGVHKRNLNDEFYKIHIKEEKNRIEKSTVLSEYLNEEQEKTIRLLVDDYFEYIKKNRKKI